MWKQNLYDERRFWHNWCRTQGWDWKDDFSNRTNPNSVLQNHVAELLPIEQDEIHILDVGSGPITWLGRNLSGKKITITCIDCLADYYNSLTISNRFSEPIQLEAEKLCERFKENIFDLVYSRNAIDHSYDPVLAIKNMVSVVKPNCYVLLEMNSNGGQHGNYHGLHQWDMINDDGRFLIYSNQSKETIDVSSQIDLAITGSDWLKIVIKK